MSTGNKQLWYGAGTLFAILFIGKQTMWGVVSKQVRDIREGEHEKAVRTLEQAHHGSQNFALKELTPAQRKQILSKTLETHK